MSNGIYTLEVAVMDNKVIFHKKRKDDSVLALFLTGPAILFLALMLFSPLFWGISMSFTDKTIGSEANFIAFDNYISLLNNKDFFRALSNTVVFTLLSIVSKLFFGVLLALILNMQFRFRGFVRSLFLIPWTLPNLVAVLNWRWIYNSSGGALNALLKPLGLISRNMSWLSLSSFALIGVVIANVWRGTPFFGITILSKLQTIPNDLYEAASIDGAGVLRKFIHVTLPEIKDVILLSTIISTIWTLNEFDTVWLMTGGGPANRTVLIAVFSYITAMQKMRIGNAVAVSVLIMPVLLILISLVTKYSIRKVKE